MNPLWWIPIAAAALLVGVFIWDGTRTEGREHRCWWCGVRYRRAAQARLLRGSPLMRGWL